MKLRLVSYSCTALLFCTSIPTFAAYSAKPLDRARVLVLMDFGQQSFRTVQLIKRNGIVFAPTGADLDMFRKFGATAELIDALEAAKPIVNVSLNVNDQAELSEIESCLAMESQGNPTGAAAECETAARYDPFIAAFAQGQIWYRAAELEIRTGHSRGSGDIRKSAAAYKRAAKADPGNPDALNGLGLDLLNMGNLGGASDAFDTAMDSDANFAPPHRNLAALYMLENDVGGATNELREVVRITPDVAADHEHLGLLLARRNDWTEAASELKRALDLNPKNVALYGQVAGALAASKQYEAAIPAYRKALALAPQWAAGHAQLARMLLLTRQPGEAISECQEAAEMAPSNASIRTFCETVDDEGRRLEEQGTATAANTGPAPMFISNVGQLPAVSQGEAGILAARLKAVPFKDFPVLYDKARSGDSNSQVMVCIAYRQGWFVKQNDATGFFWCNRAAQQKDMAAETDIGMQYIEGRGVPLNYSLGIEWLKKAAVQGSIPAMNDLGAIYADGMGVPPDFSAAMNWYQMASNAGDPKADADIGIMYLMGQGVLRDQGQAMKWLKKSASGGYAYADLVIGMIYQNGYGATPKPKEAIKWITKAADQNLPQADTELGWMYANGVGGVQQDYTQAAEWYRRGAQQGDAAAAYGLGVRYLYGQGVTKDVTQAQKWLRLAADQGHGDAAYNLGLTYAGKMGNANTDDALAVKYLTIAAKQGIGDGQCVLATVYANGKGVPKNDLAAYQWARLAMQHGAEQCSSLVNAMAARLTPDEIKQAQSRIEVWTPTPHPTFNY